MNAYDSEREPCLHRSVRGVAEPMAVYSSLFGANSDTFLYESLESRGNRGRYSFLGGRPRLVLRAHGDELTLRRADGTESFQGDLFDALRVAQRQAPRAAIGVPFASGAVGFLAYDAVRRLEQLPDATNDDLHTPDAYFVVPDEVVVFDHRDGLIHICLYGQSATAERLDQVAHLVRVDEAVDTNAPPALAVAGPLPESKSNRTAAEFTAAVERAKEYILNGDIFQVVLSQRFEFAVRNSAAELYAALRRANPSPYLYLLNLEGIAVIGSSPESLVRLEGRRATIHPLAGTRRRGSSPEADAAAADELRADPKEIAEHVMLVDLGRNDLGRVCEFGSVRTMRLMAIEPCAQVMHLVSDVEGQLRADCDAVDLLRATFPAGTVSGAPKVRAMEIIDELEPVRRGVYAGAIGYLSASGDMDVCIAIRSIVLSGGRGYVQAGAGIVADSDPMREYEETHNKARAILRAVALAAPNATMLVIDNYDSFVHNLVQYLGELGVAPVVRRNDCVTIDEIRAMKPIGIVISPGPGYPADAGISVPLIRELAGAAPILGVCLGHQAIGEAFGGRVQRAGSPMHGKTSAIEHDGRSVFAGLPTPFDAMRYHSLVVDRRDLPVCLEVSATTADGLIMGLRHRTLPIEGVQFHPESILTIPGKQLIRNFVEACRNRT